MKFLLGLLLGGAVGLLIAPAEGEETRRRLYEKAEEYAQVPQEKAADLIDRNKEKLGDLGARVAREAVQSAVESTAQELRKSDRTA
jgi:gas vesicle protein